MGLKNKKGAVHGSTIMHGVCIMNFEVVGIPWNSSLIVRWLFRAPNQ